MQLGETPPLLGRGGEGRTGVQQGWKEVQLSGRGEAAGSWGEASSIETGRERRCQAARDLVNKLSISRTPPPPPRPDDREK
ncbi:hypothetical protein XELAEV_18046192mg [Xenopus laevis]|uniref:Uncharacterized protein n=1 Tax=Xenopus laevis TaxID=8355 RepID=A0A974BSI1_XENLA|nr:hypothetical protein XELAEV_18046192mg [Xenopus laevis]